METQGSSPGHRVTKLARTFPRSGESLTTSIRGMPPGSNAGQARRVTENERRLGLPTKARAGEPPGPAVATPPAPSPTPATRPDPAAAKPPEPTPDARGAAPDGDRTASLR